MTINNKPPGIVSWAIIVSAASLLVTLPHAFEDFVYGVPQQFGLSVMAAGFLVAIGYLLQLIGMLLALHGRQTGLVLLLLIGLGWTVGAMMDHLPEILQAGPYRQGTISKVMELLIIQIGLVLVVLSAAAIRQLRRRNL
ncbi:MAG TPA: hypothetical protein VNV63_01175 [Nitrospiria bacterium]|jgi:hypothetical protein|nr:hypothetical protein [Nitrospiria bacterium]